MGTFLNYMDNMFRRDSQRRRDPDPWDPIVTGPNGIVTEHPHPEHEHPRHREPRNGKPQRPPKRHPQHLKPKHEPPEHHEPQRHQPHHGRHHHPLGQDGSQPPLSSTPATSSGQLQVALVNDTTSSNVYAYITGQAIDNNNALFLLDADGRTPVYPPSPSSTGTKISQNISIALGAPGNTVYCTIPRLAGARIWFSIDTPLQFLVNPGPGLVEPSIFNPSDPNINTSFAFAEFTFNTSQLFANISYVDFVGLPIAVTLQDTSNHTQHVSGLPATGLETIAAGLRAQTNRDGQRWSSLIVPNTKTGTPLRILSPNSAILLNPSWFSSYYTTYTNQVWGKYSSSGLTINTQSNYGDVSARVANGLLDFGPGGTFGKPTSADIFSCSSGPFATGSNSESNTVIPRLAAAFNRSTLLLGTEQPDGVGVRQYYQNPTTNHYARIVHAANLDGHGYAFPYDDVTPDGGVPQEGAVFSYSPASLTVTVGGRGAYAG